MVPFRLKFADFFFQFSNRPSISPCYNSRGSTSSWTPLKSCLRHCTASSSSARTHLLLNATSTTTSTRALPSSSGAPAGPHGSSLPQPTLLRRPPPSKHGMLRCHHPSLASSELRPAHQLPLAPTSPPKLSTHPVRNPPPPFSPPPSAPPVAPVAAAASPPLTPPLAKNPLLATAATTPKRPARNSANGTLTVTPTKTTAPSSITPRVARPPTTKRTAAAARQPTSTKRSGAARPRAESLC